MTPLSRLCPSLGLSLALCAASLSGCSDSKTSASGQPNLSGYVRTVAGAAVAGAEVATADGAHKVTTDSSGHYAFDLTVPELGSGALSAKAASYSTAFRIVPAAASTQDFTVRPFDTEQVVTLPATASDTATAVATRDDGKVTLTIPYGALKTSTGAVATGAATVKLTYWHPINDANNLPASLVARLPGTADSNTPVDLALQTVGMVDVQVWQGDEELQVVPGQHLNLDQVVPKTIALAMEQKPQEMPNPYLFYYSANDSRWLVDGNISYDANTTTLKAELPHMTIWNWDNFQNWMPPSHCTNNDIVYGTNGCNKPEGSSVGGCIAGKALKKDGSAYANSQVRLWLFDNEHIQAMDVKTDASGAFCTEVGTRLCLPTGNNQVRCDYTTNTLSYLVSSTKSADESSMANPIPAECSAANSAYSPFSFVNDCGIIADPDTGSPVKHKPRSTPATTTIKAYTYCSNSASCTHVPDTTISVDVPKTPGGSSTPPPDPCKKYVTKGAACNKLDPANQICCVAPLTCSDYVCVDPLNTGK